MFEELKGYIREYFGADVFLTSTTKWKASKEPRKRTKTSTGFSTAMYRHATTLWDMQNNSC
jgi:hypothetical protein